MADASFCWDCRKVLDAQDRYCRYCGRGQGDSVAWYYYPLAIVLLTICGIGPFSLILIWKSPVMSPRGRWISSAFVLGFTLYLLVSFFAAYHMLMAILSGLL